MVVHVSRAGKSEKVDKREALSRDVVRTKDVDGEGKEHITQ